MNPPCWTQAVPCLGFQDPSTAPSLSGNSSAQTLWSVYIGPFAGSQTGLELARFQSQLPCLPCKSKALQPHPSPTWPRRCRPPPLRGPPLQLCLKGPPASASPTEVWGNKILMG